VADNLRTTQEINKLLRQRIGITSSLNDELGRSIGLAREFCRAMDCKGGPIEDLAKRVNEVQEALKRAEREAKKNTDTTKKMGAVAEKAARQAKKLSKAAGLIAKAFRLAKRAAATFAGFAVGFLMKMYDKIIQAAINYSNESKVAAQANQDLKK